MTHLVHMNVMDMLNKIFCWQGVNFGGGRFLDNTILNLQ